MPRGLYFSKALFEGLIFGGAFIRREIAFQNRLGQPCRSKEIYRFCFVLLSILGQFPSTSPPGGSLYLEGRFNGGFFALRVWVPFIWRGLYIWRGLLLEFYGSYQLNDHWHYELETFFYMNFFSDILMQIKFNYTRQVLHLALF